jgi:hypothetical protein
MKRNTWAMRFAKATFIATAIISGAILNPITAQHCGTDALHQHLIQQYPDGLPGRTPASADKAADYNFSYVIPVVVHIMVDGGPEEGVSYPQVLSQIDVLNADFNRYGRGFNTDPDGADIKIRFCLATVDPLGAPTQGYEFVPYENTNDVDPFTEDDGLKQAAVWDTERYLNIYVVRRISGASVKGYAFFPDEVAGTFKDGIVVDYRYFGALAGTGSTLGRTCSHEIGHYLGLYHPWGLAENGCFDEDDLCDDTPVVDGPVFATFPNCNGGLACNGSPRQDANYMDYSADGCMNLFTICQADKMRSAIARYRGKLVSGDNLAALGCQAIADTLEAAGEFLVYPVPATDNLEVFAIAADGAPVDYRVFDLTGRLMASGTVTATRAPFPIDLRSFANGIYHLEVRTGEVAWVRKFMVDR